MSRPRYLADNDLNDSIVVGIRRREPAADFARASRPRPGHVERFRGIGLRCCGELDRCLPRRQHHERRGLRPPAGGSSDARSVPCKPANAGVVNHREPASYLGREPSGGMDRPGRILAALTPPLDGQKMGQATQLDSPEGFVNPACHGIREPRRNPACHAHQAGTLRSLGEPRLPRTSSGDSAKSGANSP